MGHVNTTDKSDERWWIEKVRGSDGNMIRSGDIVLIKSKAGHYLNADDGVGNVKLAPAPNRTDRSDELWIIIKSGDKRGATIRTGDKLLFKHNKSHHYLNADNAEGNVQTAAVANEDTAKSDELFWGYRYFD